MLFFVESATKRESHHHIFSTLATGTAKRLRLSHMLNGGLCWRDVVMGKKKQEMTILQLLKNFTFYIHTVNNTHAIHTVNNVKFTLFMVKFFIVIV